MNINTSFIMQTLLPITRILLAIIVIGFSYSAIAADVITDNQIRRVAKIARATRTDITITKERVTVTVHGGRNKKTARRVKKTVTRIMKQRNYVSRQSRYYQNSSDFANAPSAVSDSGFKQPPVLDNIPSSSSHSPPVLDKPAGSEYY